MKRVDVAAIFFTFKGRILTGVSNISLPEEIEEIIWVDAELAEKYAYIPTEVEKIIENKSVIPYILRGKVVYNS